LIQDQHFNNPLHAPNGACSKRGAFSPRTAHAPEGACEKRSFDDFNPTTIHAPEGAYSKRGFDGQNVGGFNRAREFREGI